MIEHHIAVLQTKRCSIRVDKAMLKPFSSPLIAERCVDILQMWLIHLLIANRFNIEIDNDVPVPQKK